MEANSRDIPGDYPRATQTSMNREPMSETIQPTVTLPSSRHGRTIAVIALAVIALAVAAGFIVRHNPFTDSTVTQVAMSGPLYGHQEMVNGQQTFVCDSSSAQAWPDSMGGVSLKVAMAGPGTVDAYIDGNNLNGGLPIHLSQQVTKRANGARFWAAIGSPVDWIRVTADTKRSSGSCSVKPTSP